MKEFFKTSNNNIVKFYALNKWGLINDWIILKGKGIQKMQKIFLKDEKVFNICLCKCVWYWILRENLRDDLNWSSIKICNERVNNS